MSRVVLALLRGGGAPPDPSAEDEPRRHVFEAAFDRVLDESLLEDSPRFLRPLYRVLPTWLSLALEIRRRQHEYDAVVTWSERLSLALAMVQSFTVRPKPHLPMMYWFSKRNVRIPMRLFRRGVHSIITWSSVQRRWAIEHLGVDADRIALVKYFADHLFWRPIDREVDMICSAGFEMRDYPTLLEALRGTGLRCHIASRYVRVNDRGLRHRKVEVTELVARAGLPNVTSGLLSPRAQRDLIARSRFVVLPIHHSDTDNGLSVLLEAMAMGKPVICSRTEGQVDVIQDGVTGIFVPVGDPAALRAAMLSLWNDPARANRIGAAARRYIEEHHTLESFTRAVVDAAERFLSDRQKAASENGASPAPEGGS